MKLHHWDRKAHWDGVGSDQPDAVDAADNRFRSLLDADAWHSLPTGIRRRFSAPLDATGSRVYRGRMAATRISGPGRWIAGLLRVIGAPLPLEAIPRGTPAVVAVTEDGTGRGQYWTLQYNRRCAFPQVIHSRKVFAGPTGFEERIGCGFGMTLSMRAEQGRLVFDSERYFLDLFRRRITLPSFLCPGPMTVRHADLGGGRFAYTLDLTHPMFGELVHQRVIFEDPKET